MKRFLYTGFHGTIFFQILLFSSLFTIKFENHTKSGILNPKNMPANLFNNSQTNGTKILYESLNPKYGKTEVFICQDI